MPGGCGAWAGKRACPCKKVFAISCNISLMNNQRADCPGCAGTQLTGAWRLRSQPVVLNYRCRDADAARMLPRRDILLQQCAACGLIFNAIFDEQAIPYDANYENRQGCSPAF